MVHVGGNIKAGHLSPLSSARFHYSPEDNTSLVLRTPYPYSIQSTVDTISGRCYPATKNQAAATPKNVLSRMNLISSRTTKGLCEGYQSHFLYCGSKLEYEIQVIIAVYSCRPIPRQPI